MIDIEKQRNFAKVCKRQAKIITDNFNAIISAIVKMDIECKMAIKKHKKDQS